MTGTHDIHKSAAPVLPPSATHPAIAACGLAACLLACLVFHFWNPFSSLYLTSLALVVIMALAIFLPDLLWQKSWRRSLTRRVPAPLSWIRVLTKYAGLAGSVGFVAFLYWLFPEYVWRHSFYGHYWRSLMWIVPLIALAGIPYLAFTDRRQAEPNDGLWQMGRLMTGRWQDLDFFLIAQNLRGWVVKGYFLPLMFTYMCNGMDKVLHWHIAPGWRFIQWYDFIFSSILMIDVSFGVVGYLMTFRAADTHLRSTEPSLFGWAVTLVCYQPFWSWASAQYINYDEAANWTGLLKNSPLLYPLWGAAIIVLMGIYVWASICFGARFSNLTHRGIITAGPYRYSKHPAYISKNLSWWLISLPFMADASALVNLRHCLMLLMLNGFYYLRAKTEERHLSFDPVYNEYKHWIAAKGSLRWLDRIPGVSFLTRYEMKWVKASN